MCNLYSMIKGRQAIRAMNALLIFRRAKEQQCLCLPYACASGKTHLAAGSEITLANGAFAVELKSYVSEAPDAVEGRCFTAFCAIFSFTFLSFSAARASATTARS